MDNQRFQELRERLNQLKAMGQINDNQVAWLHVFGWRMSDGEFCSYPELASKIATSTGKATSESTVQRYSNLLQKRLVLRDKDELHEFAYRLTGVEWAEEQVLRRISQFPQLNPGTAFRPPSGRPQEPFINPDQDPVQGRIGEIAPGLTDSDDDDEPPLPLEPERWWQRENLGNTLGVLLIIAGLFGVPIAGILISDWLHNPTQLQAQVLASPTPTLVPTPSPIPATATPIPATATPILPTATPTIDPLVVQLVQAKAQLQGVIATATAYSQSAATATAVATAAPTATPTPLHFGDTFHGQQMDLVASELDSMDDRLYSCNLIVCHVAQTKFVVTNLTGVPLTFNVRDAEFILVFSNGATVTPYNVLGGAYNNLAPKTPSTFRIEWNLLWDNFLGIMQSKSITHYTVIVRNFDNRIPEGRWQSNPINH